MSLELVVVLVIALVAGAGGVAIGILLIGPRLDRWARRDAEEANGDPD